MCEIYSRWSGGRRFGHFIIFCHPCPDWRQAAVRVGNLTLNIVCLTRGIGFRNLIQNRLNKLGKYWLLEISQNKKSCVDTTNYIRLEGWFVVDVGAGDGPLSRRGWAGAGYSVWSVINQQYFVNLLQTCPPCPPALATLLSCYHDATCPPCPPALATLLSCYHDATCPPCPPALATLLPCYYDATVSSLQCPPALATLHPCYYGATKMVIHTFRICQLLLHLYQFSPIYPTLVENSGTVHASNQKRHWCPPWPALCLVPV